MFLAESAVLVSLQPVRCVFLVFHRVVVALLALRAGKSVLDSHLTAPPFGNFTSLCIEKKGHKKRTLLQR